MSNTTKVTAPATPTAPAAGTTMVDKNVKAGSAGREAYLNRLHACAAQWHQDKKSLEAAGTMWPQFWHQCDDKMKAAGQ
jgi:hypothetical protein